MRHVFERLLSELKSAYLVFDGVVDFGCLVERRACDVICDALLRWDFSRNQNLKNDLVFPSLSFEGQKNTVRPNLRVSN